MISSIAVFFSSLVVSLLLTFPVVWLLTLFKIGQPVRAEGPATHQAKAGTPTMGGIGFVVTILALALILIDLDLNPLYLALVLLTLAYALIGLADDLLKVTRGRNLGLTFWQKICAQVVAASAFAAYLTFLGHNLEAAGLLSRLGFYQAFVYPFFLTFIIVGFANATNLTDGLNGLLGGTGTIAFLSLAVLAAGAGAPVAVTFALIVAGALVAFLYFNFPKAAVFMGDIGSLAVGAALAGLAIILHHEFRLLLIGGIFVIEALSVILQVTSFKLFKRRIFRMTPLHHTFELMGIKEWIVVVGFWVIGLIFGIAGIWI